MSRVFPNSSLKRCNQPRPIGFKLPDEDMWNSDGVLITSSPFKHWAKWGAICSCFAWNSSAYRGWSILLFITWNSVLRQTTLFWNISADIQATSRLTSENSAQNREGVRFGYQDTILEKVIILNGHLKGISCCAKSP